MVSVGEQKEWQLSRKHADLNIRRIACFEYSHCKTMCEVSGAINNQQYMAETNMSLWPRA